MVGAADHEDAVVILQPIDFVQEIASDVIRDDSVEVLEDKIAWGEPPCLVKYLPD